MSTLPNTRRRFLKLSGLAGTGLFLGFHFPSVAGEGSVVNAGAAAGVDAAGNAAADVSMVEMNAWISIDTLGKVTIIDHRAEMGQGSYQSVPQIVAEELEVDLDQIHIEFAEGNEKKYGSQITGGSSTIRGFYEQLLRLGATARVMLVEVAAKRWKVPVFECIAKSGKVMHQPTGREFHYGELVQEASTMKTPVDVPLKARKDYTKIGKPLRRRDTMLKTNGSAEFGMDRRLPGMMFAVVERNPRFRGKIRSIDDSATLKVPGVTQVIRVQMHVFTTQREGVAVIATSTWAAIEGRKLLKVTWDDTGFEHINSEKVYKDMRNLLATNPGLSFKKQGRAEEIIAASKDKLDVVYETPYQYHACMEPLNCIAHHKGDSLEVWGPIQAPDWVQQDLATQMKLKKENVSVKMSFLGGGFGRKAFTDYTHEAAEISKAIGAPVMVVWTREDDATQGPYRPGVSYRAQGVVADGGIQAAAFRLAGQSLDHWGNDERGKPNSSTTEGFTEAYFKGIGNISFSDVPFETPVPILWWRSVYASTNGFPFESFMDELAVKAGADPMAFRLKHLPDERAQRLIEKLSEVSGWKMRGKNAGYGLAITECFSSIVGQVVKVSRNPAGGIKIDQVWAVMDCGWYVNPDIIRAQVEGSVIMALGAATQHEVKFLDGKVTHHNFYDYQLTRLPEAPPIEVHIMENTEKAGGVGEPGLPPFAPALANAIFDLTGKRIRKLPFDLKTV